VAAAATAATAGRQDRNMDRFLLVSLREVQDSLIVGGVQVFRAQREHLPLSRLAEELRKVDKSFSGS
jgi:hypothetical protein